MDARGGAARRRAGLGAFDLVAIIAVIAILGVSLGALLASRNSQLSNEAKQWVRFIVSKVSPFDPLSRAEASSAPQVVTINQRTR
jgi:hypothetical protein